MSGIFGLENIGGFYCNVVMPYNYKRRWNYV